MKPVIIIAISVICSVVAVFGVSSILSPNDPEVEYVPIPTNENQIALEKYEAQLEKQRKIDSLLASDSSYPNNPIGDYWNRAKLGTIQTGDNTAFNACVQSIVGKYYSPSTTEEFYKLTKAEMSCNHLKP